MLWALAGVTALTAAVVVSVVTLGGSSRPRSVQGSTTVETIPFATPVLSSLSTAQPPWPLPADARPDIADAGLTVAGSEAMAVHYHAHLDIIVNGSPVSVPGGVGLVIQGRQETGITSLHTHDTSGVIHIESPAATPYTLGQFLTEWGVATGPGHVGGLATGNGNALRTYVDGHVFTGDPATIVLKAHQEIALWYGSATTTPHVPSGYSFPQGE